MALFAPFRALGYITDPVPFATQKRGGGGAAAGGGRDGRGSGGTVTVAVGRTWQTYDSSRLVLRLVGPAHPRDVTAVAVKGDLTWAAAGGDVYEARRVHFTTASGAGGGGGEGGGNGSAPAKPTYRGGHRPGSRIIALMPLGDGPAATLLSLGTDRQLLAWRVGEHGRKPVTRVDLSSAGFSDGERAGGGNNTNFRGDPSARPTCMCHPDTYLNKVVVGFTDGTLRLYNFATGRHLYTFDVAGRGAGGGGGVFGGGSGARAGKNNNTASASILCVAASPALDVVGCGLSDGRVVVHHLRRDARVVEFESAAGGAGGAAAAEDGGGKGNGGGMLSLLDRGAGLGSTAAATSHLSTSSAAITALCFRPGAAGGAGAAAAAAGSAASQQPLPLLAVGGGAGGIAFWDLERRRLHAVLRDAHDAAVVALHWFPGEPRVMSSGADNALKQWSLDGREAVPRLLRFRGGHAAPPTVVAHYGPGGLRLLSAGADRAFRVFSTIQDQQSRELGQNGAARRARKLGFAGGEAEAKLPRITALSASDARERDWSNVVTAHEGDSAAYTWRLAHFTRGEAVLRPTPTAMRVINAGGGRVAAGAAGAAVSAVAVTPCGNFAVVGSAAGRVDRYNLQSGLHRGGFYRRRRRASFGLGPERGPLLAPMPGQQHQQAAAAAAAAAAVTRAAAAAAAATITDANDDDDDENPSATRRPRRPRPAPFSPSTYRPRPTDEVRAAHDGAVVGVAADARGRLLVSVGADGFLRVWDFRRQMLVAEVYAGAPIARMAMHPGTGLVAVALASRAEDGGGGGSGGASASSSPSLAFPLRVFDAEAGGRLVRRFPGHSDRVTALQVSADGRWLLSAGMDGAVRVWDLPSGACVQAMAVAGPPVTALSLSPALDLLATAHANRRGVFLWANQALFGDPTAVARLEQSAGAEALASGKGRGGGGRAWERLVPVGLPSIGTGMEEDDEEEKPGRQQQRKRAGGGSSSSDDDDSSEEEDDDLSAGMSASELSSSSDYVVGAMAGGAGAGAHEEDEYEDDEEDDGTAAGTRKRRPHEALDPQTGAPRPLAPRLATLSLLPRAQVDSLLHLDAIRARGRPLAPPKKPEAAPFFLPTVPTLARHPVFGEAGGGDGDGEGDAAQENCGGSRVKRARLAASGAGPGKHEPPPSSEFVRLLREGEQRQQEQQQEQPKGGGEDDEQDNPYASFVAYALSLTPVALDSELRALALLDIPADGGAEDDEDKDDEESGGGASALARRETADLLALLTALDLELAAARNYEFCNAVLARALALHGDALSARPKLVAACASLRSRLRQGWRSLDALFQGVRCLADFFAGAQ
jgi:U3 small nucleolar RNA-associated protein 21